MDSRRRLIRPYLLTVLGTTLWLAAIILAPYLRSRGNPAFPFVYACFSPVCHQQPARSFFLFGFPLAVCARCFGIYAGFLGGLIAYPFQRGLASVRPLSVRLLVAVSAPVVVDTTANFLGLWNTSNGLRFVLGAGFGSILPFYLLAGLGDLVLKGKKDYNRNQS